MLYHSVVFDRMLINLLKIIISREAIPMKNLKRAAVVRAKIFSNYINLWFAAKL